MIKAKNHSEMPESLLGVDSEEQETIIHIARNEDVATITTTDGVMYHKVLGMCKKDPEHWKPVGYEVCQGQPQAGVFTAPKKLISFRQHREGRDLSDEEKEALRERMKRMHEAKKQKSEDSFGDSEEGE
jgi:hypothetical protein